MVGTRFAGLGLWALSLLVGPSEASRYLSVVSVFGRLAEHKALGYTSSYSVRAAPPVSSPPADLRPHASLAVDPEPLEPTSAG